MPYTQLISTQDLDEKMLKLQREKKAASELQERRHANWNESYELYRNKIRTNRLTQRQAVNIPLMKETIKTLLSRIDDAPNVEWKELGGDEQKEIYLQEIWNDWTRRKKVEWVDVVDKKNVLLYGVGTKMLNLENGEISLTALDPFNVLFDPLMNPIDIESARFIIRQNIFRTLREILADERYTAEGKEKLKIYYTSESGVIQSEKNREEWEKQMERMRAMGVDSSEFKYYAGGDQIVNLTEHYTQTWNEKEKEFERRVIVYADDTQELLDEKLVDLIGVDFWPFVYWSEDIESNDIFPDGIADLVRVPNLVINIWFSQLVENRTLRNFQMHWYDATDPNYKPQVYEPGAGVMLPAPGNPKEKIMPVEIQGLDETLTAIDFVVKIVERGSGATAIEKGVSEKKQITLGEVQILVGKAMERTVGIAKFYRGAWYELCKKWAALLEANAPEVIELYKANSNGKLYFKKLYSADWQSKEGYEPIVSSSSEHEEEQLKGVQKWDAIIARFPQNVALRKIGQKRMLELVDLTPEEMRQVEEAEEQAQKIALQQTQQGLGQPPTAPDNQELLAQNVERRMQELEQLSA